MSDSHENTDSISVVRNTFSDADYLIHCGDCCVNSFAMNGYLTVEGNVDRPNQFPNQIILDCPPFKMLIVHGHTLFGSVISLRNMAYYAKKHACNILAFGHCHMYIDEYFDGVRILNPGSVFDNRDGSEPSLMIVEIESNGELSVQRVNYRSLL
jgi:putative phosphoesterase